MANRKYLDEVGLTHLIGLLDNYPDNDILAALIDAMQDGLDEKVNIATSTSEIPNATASTSGLMSALDKQVLDNLNPNVVVTMDNMAVDSIHLINAKPENAINFEGIIEPQIGAQIRTSNLLNVDEFTPGYYIGSNGSLSTNANDHVGEFIPVTPGQDIYYTGDIGPTSSSSINRRLHVYSANQTWIKQLSFAGNLKVGNHWSTHGTVPSNGAYVRVSWGVEDTNVMISVGSPAKYEPYYITPYSPLSGITIYVSLDGTTEHMNTYHKDIPAAFGNIYSAKFNPIQGKIYATSQYIASYNGETITGQWWSDRDVYTEGGTPTIGAEVIYLLDEEDYIECDVAAVNIPLFYRNNYISVDNGYITAFSYYAETLAANHFTIYDGVTFGETHINEQNIINWNNNVDLTNQLVKTKADLQSPSFTGAPLSTNPSRGDYSERIATTTFAQLLWNNVAPVETSNKASQNYEVGDYLMFQGHLYKVTAAIAKGTTLTVNTNITATTVMDEIKAILNS